MASFLQCKCSVKYTTTAAMQGLNHTQQICQARMNLFHSIALLRCCEKIAVAG